MGTSEQSSEVDLHVSCPYADDSSRVRPHHSVGIAGVVPADSSSRGLGIRGGLGLTRPEIESRWKTKTKTCVNHPVPWYSHNVI